MPGEGLKWWGAPPDHFILSGMTNFNTTCNISLTITEISYFKVDQIHIGGQ